MRWIYTFKSAGDQHLGKLKVCVCSPSSRTFRSHGISLGTHGGAPWIGIWADISPTKVVR